MVWRNHINTVVTILTSLLVGLAAAVGQAWCKDVAQTIETHRIHRQARKRRYIHLKRVVSGLNHARCVTAAGLRTVSKRRTEGMRLGVNDGTSCPPPLFIKSLHRTPQILSYHHSRFRSLPAVQSQRIPGFNSLDKSPVDPTIR